jgi:hypothetical protein
LNKVGKISPTFTYLMIIATNNRILDQNRSVSKQMGLIKSSILRKVAADTNLRLVKILFGKILYLVTDPDSVYNTVA